MAREVDARGLLCPEPVLLTKQALDNMNGGTVKVLVSNAASRENVSRLAENKGWRVEITNQGDDILLILIK
ncbi:putative redox protein, regulator of disulfide bond formation [Desulfoscipio gibsoniae DSM 7213]|uniref:Putative redox protein, regulator of disulfide bond formation n=1 Tax=Desulfoscipio gibsoniae DSM 7213 TaxID=767817 RepID=R4KC88_9FIRM|nr:putative redox protein, regulator of disulfide bond formation [Desulfoscipio gibsoniae DSM 7213]